MTAAIATAPPNHPDTVLLSTLAALPVVIAPELREALTRHHARLVKLFAPLVPVATKERSAALADQQTGEKLAELEVAAQNSKKALHECSRVVEERRHKHQQFETVLQANAEQIEALKQELVHSQNLIERSLAPALENLRRGVADHLRPLCFDDAAAYSLAGTTPLFTHSQRMARRDYGAKPLQDGTKVIRIIEHALGGRWPFKVADICQAPGAEHERCE
jgi:hypothetical protein